VEAAIEPVEQACFIHGQIDTGNTDLLEAKFAAPGLDLTGERGVVGFASQGTQVALS